MKYEVYRIGDVCSFIDYRGKTPPKTDIGIPLITAKIVKNGHILKPQEFISEDFYEDWMKRGIPKVGDIVFTTEAPLGEVAQIRSNEKLAFAQRTIIIEPDEKLLSPDYLFYALQDSKLKNRIKARASGTTVLGIKSAELKKVEIDLPPILVQRKIASLLKPLDEKILFNENLNQNLEQQAQAIFKSQFVDFEPFGGTIPDDWKEYHLSDFLPVITGKKNANVSSEKGQYPFFSCAQDIAWTDNYSFNASAILVAGNGDFNVKYYTGKFEAYQRTYVLIPYEPKYTSWLYYAVKQGLNNITSNARGSVIKFITKGNLEGFSFYAPRDLTKCEAIDVFDSINRAISIRIQENYYLTELRETLLAHLMSGELDVSQLDI